MMVAGSSQSVRTSVGNDTATLWQGLGKGARMRAHLFIYSTSICWGVQHMDICQVSMHGHLRIWSSSEELTALKL